jgi:hypothetical protein
MVRAAEHVAFEQAQSIGDAGKTVVRNEQAHLLTHIVRKPKHIVFSGVVLRLIGHGLCAGGETDGAKALSAGSGARKSAISGIHSIRVPMAVITRWRYGEGCARKSSS